MITDIIAELQALHAGVAGIISAPTAPPLQVDTSALPLIEVVPAQGGATLAAGGLRRDERTYIAYLLVAPVGPGDEDGFTTTAELLDALHDAYLAHVSGESWVNLAAEDIGVSAAVTHLGAGGDPYWGSIITLTIVSKEV